jgi:two-component system, sensor histidine kinase and response regulator
MSQNDTEHSASFEQGAQPETRPLVLIAEPDAACRTAFVQALRGAGYGVATISDPARTVDEAARVLPALIIARVTDPVTDGFSLCRELRASADTRDIPLLVLTRLDDPYAREQIVRAGATAILTEPLRRTLLLRQVRRQLARGARTSHSRTLLSWNSGTVTESRPLS